jgi:hypothetical protein
MQSAIVISNAFIIATILVGGFYLRNVVNRQEALANSALKAKDATIEQLKSEIDRLTGLTAPALVEEIWTLTRFADERRKLVGILTQELDKWKDMHLPGDGVTVVREMSGAYLSGMIAGVQVLGSSAHYVAAHVEKGDYPQEARTFMARFATMQDGFVEEAGRQVKKFMEQQGLRGYSPNPA